MQPIDALTLHHLAAELDVKLADGKINKIQQASHFELLLHLWVGGKAGRQKLYINIEPEFAFCTFIEDSTFLTFPEKAPNFCMVLRKHLTGARIQRIQTLPNERVLNITMENYNELGQQVYLTLAIELMGKQSNLILYDNELKLILGCAHGVSEQMSRKREISVGYPYVPPPRPMNPPLQFANRCDVTDHIEAALSQRQDPAEQLIQHYSGVGKATLKEVFDYAPDPDKAYEILQELFQGIHLFPALQQDFSRYSLLPVHQEDPQWIPMSSINGMIQAFYVKQLQEKRLGRLQQQLRQIVKAQEKKIIKRRQELEKTDLEAIEGLKKAGDLLMIASSQNLPVSSNGIELMDYDTEQTKQIEIDPALSLLENAQLYYRRYKKAQARQNKANEDLAQLQSGMGFITEINAAIDRATTWEEIQSIREDLEAQGWAKPLDKGRKSQKPVISKPLSFMSSDGFTVLVGKNSLQNDQLVGKLAYPDDLWLHAHLIPGSHVLVKSKKQAIPDSTLLQAAILAAYYSQARHSVNVPVVYTKARYVRKIPNSYPGHVTYTDEKAINVTPDESMVATLLSQSNPIKV